MRAPSMLGTGRPWTSSSSAPVARARAAAYTTAASEMPPSATATRMRLGMPWTRAAGVDRAALIINSARKSVGSQQGACEQDRSHGEVEQNAGDVDERRHQRRGGAGRVEPEAAQDQ